MRKGIIKKGKLRAILLSFVLIFTLSGCQHKDIYDTEIEMGTYTAKLIYQYGTTSYVPSDFEVNIDEMQLSITGYLVGVDKPFDQPLSPVTLTKEIWPDDFPDLDLYSTHNSAYREEDTLDKLYKVEWVFEAGCLYDEEILQNIYYVYYFDLFRVNGKIYMFHRAYSYRQDKFDENWIAKVARIFRLVKE